MKNFTRSLIGKAIFFLAFIISFIIFSGSMAAIYLYNDTDIDWYTSTEASCVNDVIGYEFGDCGISIMSHIFFNDDITDDYEYRVKDDNGFVVASTPYFEAFEHKAYTATVGVLKNKDSQVTDFFLHRGPIYDESVYYYTLEFVPKEGTKEAFIIDQFRTVAQLAYRLRYAVYGIAIITLITSIIFFIALMASAGRRKNTDEIVPSFFCRIPYDLLFAASGFLMLMLIYMADAIHNDTIQIFVGIMLLLMGLVLATLLCMVAATNIKRKMFFKNTLVYMVLHFAVNCIKKAFGLLKYLPLIWKTILAVTCVFFFELLAIVALDGEQEELVACLFFIKIITIPVILYIAAMLKKLQESGRALAGGNLSYHTDTSKMVLDLKEHGENLNNIAVGMTKAVDERMRSERMKTELITNVSHDIKTPLTSIINYATLIGDGLKDNPEMAEYTEVLVRQSDKLKRLIEDLVEASKASTGNLEVALTPCDASIFLTQAGGEYEEKLEKAQLTLITKTPSEELRIMADGRRMWRIFDNLMNNICKYSLPGTRVYLSLERMGNYAVITFKNTSREALDMTEAELMERFTRGDSSRSTEGNGLGLSIAKSLAELQNGRLNIALDGDLFKAVLSFPLVMD